MRVYEESIVYSAKKSKTVRVIRVVQNKTHNDAGSIGFDFKEIKE